MPVSTFELYLPEGPYSALAATGNLCATTKTITVKHRVTTHVHGRTVRRTVKTRERRPASLQMPTEFVAQNGAVIHEITPIKVTGCTNGRTHK